MEASNTEHIVVQCNGSESKKCTNGSTPRCRHRRVDMPPHSNFKPIQLILNIIHPIFVAIGKLRVVHYIYGAMDNVMYKSEKILEWCLPELSPKKTDKKAEDSLERPLPWILFIPTLIVVRVVRFNVSLVNLLINKKEITTMDMMNGIQKFRMYIRGIRSAATKSKDSLEERREQERMKYLPWRIFYRIKYIFVVKPFSTSIKYSEQETKAKRSLSPDEGFTDDELNCDELLKKYAENDNDTDPNYMPDDEGETSESSDDDSEDSEVDEKEVEKLQEEAKKDVEEIIKELPKEFLTNGDHHDENNSDDTPKDAQTSDSPKENGYPEHQQNGHHEHHECHHNDGSSARILTPTNLPRKNQSLSEKKYSSKTHSKRQQFSKYKSKSFSQEKKLSKIQFKRQNSQPIPKIIITQHD